EDIDPVRFIGNRSTGRMGFAVAKEAISRGASVTVIAGPTHIEPPAEAEVVHVRSAAEMDEAVKKYFGGSDVTVMAAAVADYMPVKASADKIKKSEGKVTMKLVRTPDILKSLGEMKRKGQVLVGFAAETENLERNAFNKLKEKKLDLIAANIVGGGRGFASLYNELKIFGGKGLIKETGVVTKEEAAKALFDCIVGIVIRKS
ncbi:MAG: phosphopantothenoylcysteine decarboxylase, partial [Nitrospirota bacterium]